MPDNGGLPLDAEHDEGLHVVTAERYLTNDEYADVDQRTAAEVGAREAVETLMGQLKLTHNDAPMTHWMAGHVPGGGVRGHHFEYRARVRPLAD